MKEPSATLLTVALACVSIVEAEERATRARLFDVARVLFEAGESDEEIDAALLKLVSWGLVQLNEHTYSISGAGKTLLSKCQEETRSQREHLEGIEKIFSARLSEGSNNSLKGDAAKPRTLG
jgi:hypothetical protein